MNLPQRHKEILLKEKEEIEKNGMSTFRGGFIYVNDRYKDVIIEDIKVHNFTSMYPHIMILLHEEGLISIPEEVQKMKWFFENRDELKKLQNSEYSDWKYWVNSLYGKFAQNPNGHLIMGLIPKYQYILYKEILNNNPENILYVDTDMILSVNSINLGDCPLPYSNEILTLGIIQEKKRYAIHDGQELKVRGYPRKKHEEVKREVQSRIRQHQLEKLGITDPIQLKLF